MLNVFVCSENYELLAQLIAIQCKKQDFHIQGFSSRPLYDPLILAKNNIDVMYVQFSQIEQHWQQWINVMSQQMEKQNIRLIVSFSSLNEEQILFLLRYSIESYLMEPFDGEQLYAMIHQQQQVDDEYSHLQEDLDRKITTILLRLMIPTHMNGFHYLKMACMIAVSIPTNRQVFMKNLYSIIAKQYHSTSSRVEKCIRSAIHSAKMPKKYSDLFHGDPTNRKIIMYVYTCLKGII
ncbi:sporulation initiation factor Spo0A C-terminal domain-containing protein [Merdibacter massiliensis]|uniref:sporulation initiation factor Spo0A C-terminal domain-containing protein n=1 Tax=Merdibacter massiliensis TaxID=1871030 RepID=UPI00096A59B0|nr:sporulation initiation factor Spo0A C-terminal domain-containing protein [Merdibacter massiliensis]